jgi:hypothetical protein
LVSAKGFAEFLSRFLPKKLQSTFICL